jgi:hypothetical protein
MTEQGMARTFSVLGACLGLLWSLGLAACATSEAGEPPAEAQLQPGPASALAPGLPEARQSGTQQVVQHLQPTAERITNAPVLEEPLGTRVPAQQPNIAGEARAQDRAAAPISATHLEAELNRLEAELGR